MPKITDTFLEVLDNPDSLDSNMKMIKRFIIILYDRTSSEDEVNAARKVMFANKGRELDKIPPTRDALVQHSRRAILQASFVWHDMLKLQFCLFLHLQTGAGKSSQVGQLNGVQSGCCYLQLSTLSQNF